MKIMSREPMLFSCEDKIEDFIFFASKLKNPARRRA
jgi:hypothetical protein